MESFEIVKLASNALNEKKAKQISAIKVADLTVIADYFVIATATSSTHVHSLADEVEAKLTEAGFEPHHIEGKSTGWIVLDYSSVIIHIFTPDQREFYGLDNIWSDGKSVDLSENLKKLSAFSFVSCEKLNDIFIYDKINKIAVTFGDIEKKGG